MKSAQIFLWHIQTAIRSGLVQPHLRLNILNKIVRICVNLRGTRGHVQT